MSPRQWLALLGFYTMYLFFGASVFYYTEHGYETQQRTVELQKRIAINDLLVKYTSPNDVNKQNEILKKVSTYCKKPVTNHTLDEYVDPHVWSFYHSVFFSFTVCSTLGYGNITPTHSFGRYFMILYALIGMPVNAILYTYLGEFFGKTFTRIYKRYKAYKIATNKNYVPRRLGMIAQVSLYLVPASIVLIFLPSCLFTYFEGWTYSDSVYYSFVTLSTIGFGDFIPTFQPHQNSYQSNMMRFGGVANSRFLTVVVMKHMEDNKNEIHMHDIHSNKTSWMSFSFAMYAIPNDAKSVISSTPKEKVERVFGIYFQFYQAFVIIWLVFGLSYLLMLIGFIARGMRSKRIARLEHQLSENIKITQNRIWSGVTKDVSYLRRILNEIYMLKFKPVYDESDDDYSLNSNFPRSASCPSLQLYRTDLLPEFDRKRTLSEHYVYSHFHEHPSLLSRHSESDLSRINKTKTFQERNESQFDTGKVLARVVHALSHIAASDDDNNDELYDNMHDTETVTSVISLKSSEQEYSIPPIKPRLRAASAYRKPSLIPSESPHKWTWNGTNAQIQEFRNIRDKLKITGNECAQDKNRSCSIKIEEPSIRLLIPTSHNKVTQSKVNQFLKPDYHHKRYSVISHDTLHENLFPKGRPSRIGYMKQLQNSSSSRRPSIFEIQENKTDQSLLENTTIADLIRVLETAHTLNNSSNDPVLKELLGVNPAIRSKRSNNRRASMYPHFSEQSAMLPLQHIPILNGNYTTHDDQIPLSKPELNEMGQRRFSIHPNPLRRSSITVATSIKQRRQSMRPSHWMNNNFSDTTEVTGRFTVSKRLRPTNSFRMQNNFLRRAVVQSSQNRLSELNEKSDDKIV